MCFMSTCPESWAPDSMISGLSPRRTGLYPAKELDSKVYLVYNVYGISRQGGSMRLTTKSEYSLLALIYIARNIPKGFAKIEDICREYKLPKKYLEQLLMILKRSGYLKTKRGAGGGYGLAKPPSKISVADIIRLMDGALAPTESVSMYFYSETPLMKEWKIMSVFKEIRDYASKKLERLKLSHLV